MQTGIPRYNSASKTKPQTNAWDGISLACSDGTYTSLRPVLPWTVGDLINSVGKNKNTQLMSVVFGPSTGQSLPGFPQAFISFRNVTGNVLQFTPLQINFSKLIFLDLDNTKPWNPLRQGHPEGRTNNTD